ncbi:MAG: adenylosuccinate lyase [Patescibacteria group bacterium]
MIDRYFGERMKALFGTNRKKFERWRDTEIAVLAARVVLEQINPTDLPDTIARTWVDDLVTRAIERRDALINHDLNAFLDIMRLELILSTPECERIFRIEDDEAFNQAVTEGLAQQAESRLAGVFHNGMTSYDTEEPAMSLLLLDACEIILQGLAGLSASLLTRANQHRSHLMMGRTHGQHAQPITFGIKLLGYHDMVWRSCLAFQSARDGLRVMKLSGAVGTYGTLTPELETEVGKQLELTPVIATQIISLDRRARVVNELALIACVLEKIARDLWHLSTTEVGEVREPFGKKQKGSSAMPHKKNPITLEKVFGLASHVRGNAAAIMENVATSHERDISHSSVERLALVDAFVTVDHMLACLRRIVMNMDVFPERMLENIGLSYGTLASQRVEMLLKKNGMPAEAAYRVVQRDSFAAVSSRTPLFTVLLDDVEARPFLPNEEDLKACFDLSFWVNHSEFIFERHASPAGT